MSMMNKNRKPDKIDTGQSTFSSPSLLQRIARFIDSPCSGFTSIDLESVVEFKSTPSNVHINVVTPIKSPMPSFPTRRPQNRSYASRQVRRNKLRLSQGARTRDLQMKQQSPPVRRVKSFQCTPSPTSVTDAVFWADSTQQEMAIQDCCAASDKPDQPASQWSLFCCNDITSANTFDYMHQVSPKTKFQECDGFIDYSGVHHPHKPQNCRGCAFRSSLFDGEEKTHDDLYYDSDYEFYLRDDHIEDDHLEGALYLQDDRTVEDEVEIPMARAVRKSYPPDVVDNQRSLDYSVEDASIDRQTYLYDYFMKNQQQPGVNDTDVDAGVRVQEALNSTWKLCWHTTSSTNSKSAFLPQPKPCTVWIERGYRRNINQAVEPRLMWKKTKTNANHVELMERPNSISLLAIRRIVPGEQVAESFIFTKSHCMIVVKTSVGKDYYFEAFTSTERDNILHLWKITTARLVSYAATESTEQMMTEFFNEYSVH